MKNMTPPTKATTTTTSKLEAFDDALEDVKPLVINVAKPDTTGVDTICSIGIRASVASITKLLDDGRTDEAKGKRTELYRSVCEKIAAMPVGLPLAEARELCREVLLVDKVGQMELINRDERGR